MSGPIASLIRLVGYQLACFQAECPPHQAECPPLIRLIAPLIRWDAGSPASSVQHSARHGAAQPKVVHEDDVDEEVVELEVELPSEAS